MSSLKQHMIFKIKMMASIKRLDYIIHTTQMVLVF